MIVIVCFLALGYLLYLLISYLFSPNESNHRPPEPGAFWGKRRYFKIRDDILKTADDTILTSDYQVPFVEPIGKAINLKPGRKIGITTILTYFKIGQDQYIRGEDCQIMPGNKIMITRANLAYAINGSGQELLQSTFKAGRELKITHTSANGYCPDLGVWIPMRYLQPVLKEKSCIIKRNLDLIKVFFNFPVNQENDNWFNLVNTGQVVDISETKTLYRWGGPWYVFAKDVVVDNGIPRVKELTRPVDIFGNPVNSFVISPKDALKPEPIEWSFSHTLGGWVDKNDLEMIP
jgi:hypothetical protein